MPANSAEQPPVGATKPPPAPDAAAAAAAETHKCPYQNCGKYFSKKYNLKAHLRLHTGEQPFECPRPDCRKKFKWRSSLSSHSVWHTRKEAGSKRPRPLPAAASAAAALHAPAHAKKKRARKAHAPAAAAESMLDLLDAAIALPGSPVTSESDKSLDVELFQGAVLPPLSTVSACKMEDELLVHEGDVNAAILADTECTEFFAAAAASGAGAGVPALDTRFGPFELDNLTSFCMGK